MDTVIQSGDAASNAPGTGFLLRLGDALRGLSDPLAILAYASESLGSHLGVSRCGYAEVRVDDGTFVVERDWTDGTVKHGVGRRPMAAFGDGIVGPLYRGETLKVCDYGRDDRVAPTDRAAFDEMSIVAAVTVPLVKNGDLVAMLSLHQTTPRDWTSAEVRLIEEVAERTWAALERARAEAQLRESETQLHMLADHMSQLAWIADAGGDVVWYNRRWYEFTGVPEGGADGWLGIIAPEALAETQGRVAGAMVAGEPFELILPLRRADGVHRPFLTRVQPMRAPNGGVVRWFGTHTDIGEQLEWERHRGFLLALEDRLRPMKDPVVILQTVSEALGRHLGVNRAGYSEVDETGEYLIVEQSTWTDGRMPDSVGRHPLESFGPTIIAALRRGESLVCPDMNAEERLDPIYRAPYLGLGIVSLVTKPLLKGGKLVAIMTVNQDEPRPWPDAEVRLIDEVAERTWATLARARAEAELAKSREALYQSEKLTALGSLLAGVSHEINNPLAVVVAQAMLLEADAEGSPLGERAGKIRRAAERCARIVQTFLAMARQKPPVRTTVSPNAVVLSALDLTGYGLRTAGVTVSTKLADDLPPLSADADQLHQVLANLLINAQHALQDLPGPREVAVYTRAGREPGTVEIEVADNGNGVAPELRRRVFEPFFTTKPQGGGTGLGLSYSHGVVEAHGGRIELLDRSKGAAFVLVLPAVATAADAGSAEAENAHRRPPPPGSALLVDDEADVAEVLAEILEGQGFRVTTAASGREAKARLRAEAFDIVLSDLRMPDLDGPGLYDWIRRERPELAERTGFITGDTLGPAVARFLADAGRPYLEKPFTPGAVGAFAARLRRGDTA